MSGINKLQTVQQTERITLGQGESKIEKKQEGSLVGRLVSWISRSDAQKIANNDTTKAFFDSIEKTYGREIKNYAIAGYESRIRDGKPLTGRRIQQILARAQDAQKALPNERAIALKARLFDQKKSELLSKELDRLNIPADQREHWAKTLAERLPRNPGFNRENDPRHYDEEFRGLIRSFIENNRGLFEKIGPSEAKQPA